MYQKYTQYSIDRIRGNDRGINSNIVIVVLQKLVQNVSVFRVFVAAPIVADICPTTVTTTGNFMFTI